MVGDEGSSFQKKEKSERQRKACFSQSGKEGADTQKVELVG